MAIGKHNGGGSGLLKIGANVWNAGKKFVTSPIGKSVLGGAEALAAATLGPEMIPVIEGVKKGFSVADKGFTAIGKSGVLDTAMGKKPTSNFPQAERIAAAATGGGSGTSRDQLKRLLGENSYASNNKRVYQG
jgi:hypothetical protein